MASTSEIEKLERRYAENPEGRFFAPLADAYRKAGQVDRALELVRAGLTKHPDYLSAHIVLGRCLLDKNADADATQTFQSVLALDGENIIALKSLAEIAERGGRVDEAKGWLQKLLVVDSMNAEAEADLTRLGGAVAAPAAPAEEVVEAAPETSFADVAREIEPAAGAEPSSPTVVTPAPVVAAAPAPVAVAAPEPEPAVQPEAAFEPELEPIVAVDDATRPIEAISLDVVEPEAAPVAEAPAAKPDPHPLPASGGVEAGPLDVVPFDDSLAWGTGERSSRAIHVEDIEAVQHDDQVTTPAIEFIAGIPGATPADLQAPAAAPPAGVDDFVIEAPPDQSLGGMAPEEEQASGVELPANLSGAYSLVDEVPPPEEVAARASMRVPAAAADLPLIMPEDVTPPEELARPSARMVQSVSPPPREEPVQAAPMATETMGDLYLKQGFRAEAADVFRRLLALRPHDAGLAAKLRAAEGPPPDLSAASLGAESVGTWLRRVASSRLSMAAAPAPQPASSDGPSPLEAAFSTPPHEARGEPARPARDAFSLDQIFGPTAETPAAAAPAAKPAPPAALGASFDDFFGPPPAPAAKPAPPAKTPGRPSKLGEEDLSAFSAWLQGLKK